MRIMKSSACAVAFVSSLLVSGCGRSTGVIGAPNGLPGSSGPASTSASAAASTGAATTAPATTAASSTSAAPAAKTFTAASFKAALLPASALGSGLKADDAGMFSGDRQSGRVSMVATEDCELVLAAGFSYGSTSQVELSSLSDSSAAFVDVTQETYQFGPGIAASVFPQVAGRVDTTCKSFAHTTKNGTKVTATARQHSVSGLGDQAVEIEEVVTWPSLTFQVRQLAVRYGDVVIVVIVDTAEQSRTKAYDLAGKVKAIAAALKLR